MNYSTVTDNVKHFAQLFLLPPTPHTLHIPRRVRCVNAPLRPFGRQRVHYSLSSVPSVLHVDGACERGSVVASMLRHLMRAWACSLGSGWKLGQADASKDKNVARAGLAWQFTKPARVIAAIDRAVPLSESGRAFKLALVHRKHDALNPGQPCGPCQSHGSRPCLRPAVHECRAMRHRGGSSAGSSLPARWTQTPRWNQLP
jgi:hypothetical protein